jgi:hypothetical protein
VSRVARVRSLCCTLAQWSVSTSASTSASRTSSGIIVEGVARTLLLSSVERWSRLCPRSTTRCTHSSHGPLCPAPQRPAIIGSLQHVALCVPCHGRILPCNTVCPRKAFLDGSSSTSLRLGALHNCGANFGASSSSSSSSSSSQLDRSEICRGVFWGEERVMWCGFVARNVDERRHAAGHHRLDLSHTGACTSCWAR